MAVVQIMEEETEFDKTVGAEVVRDTANSTNSTPTKAKDSNAKLCEVCKQQPSKYKCTRCFLPYCSVNCSTIHKATHPAVEAESSLAVSSTNEVPPSRVPTSACIPAAGTVAAAGSKGPFAALENSKELKSLFELYPGLNAQLDEINAATLRPLHSQNANNGQIHGFRKPRGMEQWNQDRGMENGIKALQRARSVYGKEGEAVREYSRLVLRILSGEEGCDASDMVQRELDEENARVIQLLLQIEKR
ncbi:Zinc finger HIT-type protein [Rutstroemia sp. NJR-2017a BVV2]|nr:Zinc finger HIT-type protein [Rutstroemia sp. NJR-2017a BVV2]